MEDSNPQKVSLMSVFWTAALPLGESSVLFGSPVIILPAGQRDISTAPYRKPFSGGIVILREHSESLTSAGRYPASGGRCGSRTRASEDMSLAT